MMNQTTRSHRARVLSIVIAAVSAITTTSVGSAGAATVIGPPSVSSPTVFFTWGVPATFTFTQGSGSPAVAFDYEVNGGPVLTMTAVSGTAQASITPLARINNLSVTAVAADGTLSAPTLYTAFAERAVPASDKDLNGDGVPDLVTTGGTAGLGAGIWQALGTGSTGRLLTAATNISGTANGGGPDSYFDGAQLVVGHYSFEGFQDLVAYFPGVGTGLVMPGSGDGSALSSDGVFVLPNLNDPITGDNPLRITGGLDASNAGNGFDGLFAITGDTTHGWALDYDVPNFVGFTPLQLRGQATPDGTADWNDWTLATAQTPTGIDMFLWDQSTGRLYLWTNLTVTANGSQTGTLSYTQYKLANRWNVGASLTVLEAADFGGAATAGLWSVDLAGVVDTYLVNNLSASNHTGTICLVHTRHLS